MEYFLEFHWWYVLVIIIVLFVFFGKGGIVVDSFTAQLNIVDNNYHCNDAYCARQFFKNGKDESIKIDIQDINLPTGEVVDVLLNGTHFKTLKVKGSKEIEFDMWNDDPEYVQIQPDDKVGVYYQGKPILEGIFEENTDV